MPPSQYLPFTACMKFVLFKKHSSIDNLLSPAWPTLSLFLLWAPTVDEATHLRYWLIVLMSVGIDGLQVA